MSKILANQIANFGDDSPIEIKEGLNVPAGKPIQAAGNAGTSGQVLSSTGTSIAWITPFSGDYNSLTNKPTIPAAQINSDWNATSGLGVILNKPTVPPLSSVTTAAAGTAALSYNSTNGEFTFTPPDLSGYATEAWVGSQGYLTSYTETDTLSSVVARGNNTGGDIVVSDNLYLGGTGSTSSHRLWISSNDILIQNSQTGGKIKASAPSGFEVTGGNYGNTLINVQGGVTLYEDSGLSGSEIRLATTGTGMTFYGDIELGSGDITTTGKLYYSNNFATTGDLPNATTYHGMFAHVHAEGHGYFAHAGAWTQLLDTGSSISELADVNLAVAPQSGQVLAYDGSNWVATAAGGGGGGIALTDLSVSTASAGTAALTYNNVSGVFTYTPPDLSGYLTTETSHADVVVDGDFTSNGLMKRAAAGSYVIVTDNSSNWDTAYGWGDHAAAGYSTLPSQATNVVIGDATTGDAIITGATDNVIIGSGAGSAITNQDDNVFIGLNAGAADIGNLNIAIGANAGDTSYGEFANVENVAVGRVAGDIRNGNGNTALGFAALSSSATSAFSFGNIALGYYAMGNYKVDGARYNTAIGQQAGYNLSSGDANVFLGDYAGSAITTGSNNILIGTTAGDDITTGDNNVIINSGNYQNGATSGFTTTTSNSLWIGHSSYAWITGASSGNTRTVTIPGQLTAGGLTYPTSNGTSGQVLTSDGAGNVTWSTVSGGGGGASVTVSDTAPGSATAGDLWWESDTGRLKIYYQDTDSTQWVDTNPPLADATSIGGSGTVAMKASLIPDTNAAYDLGNAEYKIRDIYEDQSSDIRLKKDVVDYTGGLNFVESLRVVDFTWKDDVDLKAGKRETGFIAQELGAALEASNYNSWRLHNPNPDSYQGIDPKQLIPALVSAIQELSARVKELENK